MISPALEEGGVDESGRGVASAVKDYACCGSEDDLDQGLDFERGEAASAVEDAVEDAGPGFAPHGVDDPESEEAADAVEDAAEDAGPGFAAHGVDDPESGRPPSYVEAAAGAVKDYVKDEVKGKAEGLFASISADDLVDTPGSTQVLAQIFIFFAQKPGPQRYVCCVDTLLHDGSKSGFSHTRENV